MDVLNFIVAVLGSPAGSFAFVLGILLLAGWLIYFVTKKVTEITSGHSTLTKSTEKIESFIDELRKDMAYLKGSFEYRNDLAQSHSPVSLTDKGKSVSEEIGAEMLVANNWEKIYQTLETEVCDKNAYDIQQYCIETAAVEPEKFFSEKDLSKLKLFAYQKGKTFQYFSVVLAILIRDRYFEEKNISTDEVDKFNPRLN